MRRGPGRRTNLSLHHPIRRHEKADQASLAAIDDAGGYSRCVRAIAQRRRDATAGQRRRSRNEADWLVGINATRAFTLRLSGGRGSSVTSLGRVQTPTLTIIVDRENKIKELKPRELHEIIGTFRPAVAGGEYAGRWFDEAFKKE